MRHLELASLNSVASEHELAQNGISVACNPNQNLDWADFEPTRLDTSFLSSPERRQKYGGTENIIALEQMRMAAKWMISFLGDSKSVCPLHLRVTLRPAIAWLSPLHRLHLSRS